MRGFELRALPTRAISKNRAEMTTARPVFNLPKLVAEFPEQRVVVVAPHMDDEAIGCGGTVLCHHKAGAQITTVFLTNGEVGRPCSAEPHVRHDEARRVASYLKMEPPRFLDGPDTALTATEELVTALAHHLDDLAPDLIYAPWIGDAHRDHVMANALLAGVAPLLVDTDTNTLRVRAYEVWSPLPANISVDITTQMNRKLQAMQMYQSQFVAHDPAPLVGLNRYRSMGVGGPATTHVECFHEATWPDYLRHIEATL